MICYFYSPLKENTPRIISFNQPTMTLSYVWAPILFTLFTLSLVIIPWLLKPKQTRPPGPLGLPIIGNLLSLPPQLHSYFTTLAQTYGPILSLQLGSKLGVIISSPALAKDVLKDHDVIFANRDVPAAGKLATYGGSDIAWSPYGPEWRLLRKVCVRDMLGAATLDGVYEIRRREVRRTVSFLSGRAGRPVNVGEQMFLTVLNVVTGMLWGGTVQTGEERERIGREFRQAVMELTHLLGAPNLSDFFPGLGRFDLQGIEKRMRVCAKRFDGIFDKVIDLRLRMDQGEERQKDFLEVLLRLKDYYVEDSGGGEGGGSGDKVEFSMTHLKALLMDMVVGGTDSSANTVEFAMAEVLNKPAVLEKILHELDTVVGIDNTVEEHHIHKLPYLQAVMKETLRIHPILPLLIPHSPSESCIIGGYTIPKGSRVFINVWAIHRDPLIWANPLEFNPERFLNAKFDFNGKDFSYFPFGSGRRICAGIAMAERMVLFSLATLLHSFNWRLPQGENLDLEEKFGIVLSKRVPLVLIPEPRLQDPALYE